MKVFPSGAAVLHFDTLDSTSLEAKRLAQKGEDGPVWIMAVHQSAAYGRRQRAWEQQAGDLATTLLFEPQAPLERFGQLSFVISLALANALCEFMPVEQIGLKWPNDVMLGGNKCAGILLETVGTRMAIGIGVNIVTAPDNLAYETAKLTDFSATPPSPTALAARIDNHFFEFYDRWVRLGFGTIRDAWQEKAVGLGESLTVRLPNEEFGGIFEGVDDTGRLILRSGSGKRTVAAGEVFFGPRNEPNDALKQD